LIFQWLFCTHIFIAEHKIPPFLSYLRVSLGVLPPVKKSGTPKCNCPKLKSAKKKAGKTL
jgi:hypothetical protein